MSHIQFIEDVKNGNLVNVIRYNGDVHINDDDALVWACECNQDEVAKYLLDCGSNPMAQNGHCITLTKKRKDKTMYKLLRREQFKDSIELTLKDVPCEKTMDKPN